MIIVQSLIKIVKTVNCKQIDQVKKKKKERKKRTEQNRAEQLDWLGRGVNTYKYKHTHIHTRISHAEKTGCAYLYVHTYVFLYISFMYCAYLPCWTRLRSSDCQCWRLQLPVNKTRIVSLLENVDSSAGASIKETAIYRIGSQFDIF